ncbi:MAG: bifunctional oligoribonuclease/PAP phosphatase NrnA [Treponema sp.]|nr:bifunctional oligoribonuclease/PAP phosphatase NrnA [Treponema sp.]MCL2252543.1 bifunctional oligoribonuclease/PAP phosphatase NrnA [Treponema sp.]
MESELNLKDPPEELVQFISNCSRFILAGHKEPDGDCVGSQLALRSALQRLGKEVIVCSAGPFTRTEIREYTEQFIKIPDEEKTDTKVIIIDCSGRDRTGDIQDFLAKFPCAIIDHHAAIYHPPSTKEEPVYVDSNAPSSTLLVYKLIKVLGLELTEEEATLLFFGLCTDTGFFRYLNNNTAFVFEAAAVMVRYGANPKKTFNVISGGKSLHSRIQMGNILSRTESFFNGKLLITYETLEEFQAYGFESRDSESLNQLLLSIEGIEAVVIIRQECADNCTVSLRSIDKINVAQIASFFGGGGHKNAAGLTMKGDVSVVKKIILNKFQNILFS